MSSSVVIKESVRESRDLLYYIDCPRCERPIQQPFSRLGGPQFSEHFCGNGRRPRKARFLVAASGEGYFAYALDKGEWAEPIMEKWVTYWMHHLRETLPLRPHQDGDRFKMTA